MDPKKIERLKALIAKDEKSLEAKEKTELASLQKEAKEAGLDPETGEKVASGKDDDEDEPEGMTEDDVKNVVVDALKGIGLDGDMVTKIKEDLDSKGEGLNIDDIKAAIKAEIGGDDIDQDALVKSIKEVVGKQKGVSADELDTKLKEFSTGLLKEVKSASKMQFSAGGDGLEFPIEHRSGNLSVSEKQLLNLCLMGVSEEALETCGTKRPSSLNEGIDKDLLTKAKNAGTANLKRLGNMARRGKALTSDTAGSGAELSPTDLGSDLQSRLYLESRLATAMMGMEINMPSSPFKLPISTVRPSFYVGSQGGTPTESSGDTDEIVLSDKKLIGQADYSYEADEDSIVAVLPMLQQNMGEAAAAALESAIINGDSDGTHQDSDFEAISKHHAKLFDGFRKFALANGGALASDIAGTGITAPAIGSLRKAMGKFGVRPRDLMIVCGVNGYNDIIQLDQTLTAEKVGTQAARILTGEAPTLYGIPIIVSEQVREDLNTSGVYDACTTSKGSIFIVHKPSFLLGVRRGFMVEIDVDKKSQMNSVVASFRRAFQPKETPDTTIRSLIMGYNYDS